MKQDVTDLAAFQRHLRDLRAAPTSGAPWGVRVKVMGEAWWVPLHALAGILPPSTIQSWSDRAPEGVLGVVEHEGRVWTVRQWGIPSLESWLLLTRPTPSAPGMAWVVDGDVRMAQRPDGDPQAHANAPQGAHVGWLTSTGWCWQWERTLPGGGA